MYFVVRVTSSQERISADILQNKVEKTNLPVYAIVVSEGMRGYLIVEAQDLNTIKDLVQDEPHMKGVLSTPLSKEELDKMIAIKNVIQEIASGDIVEFVSGPFKGYKAKVIKSEKGKEEITVELMDVAVPIPVTTKAGAAKIIEKAEKAGS
ncbi:MAG: transcription elongation factor Spt5 [Candidatus Micrarchaeaceae archaeon]